MAKATGPVRRRDRNDSQRASRSPGAVTAGSFAAGCEVSGAGEKRGREYAPAVGLEGSGFGRALPAGRVADGVIDPRRSPRAANGELHRYRYEDGTSDCRGKRDEVLSGCGR